MSLSELKTVLNDIVNDYNLDIIALICVILFGVYTFFVAPKIFVNTTDAVIDGHLINVNSRAYGQVIHSYIIKDQEVSKGDLIIEIDSTDYKNELIKLETDLEINKEKLRMLTNAPLLEDLEQSEEETSKPVATPPKYRRGSQDYTNYSRTYEPEDLAEQNLERKKTLKNEILLESKSVVEQPKEEDFKVPKPVIDKTKIDITNDTVESVQREIKNIQTQKEEVKLRLSATKVFAPQDGVISEVSVSEGDVVNPSDVLCSIIPKQVWILARVNPERLAEIKIGQPVTVKIPYYKHRTFKGSITSVDKTAKVYQVKPSENLGVEEKQPVAYQIKIDFVEDYSDFNLTPETEVKVKIRVKSFPEVE